MITLVSIWFGWTVLIDFFVVRTVFAIVPDFFVAGTVGIALFSKLNYLEALVSTALLGVAIYRKKKIQGLMAIVLAAIAIFYLTFLTPKIVEITEFWKQGTESAPGYPDLQQAHQFWHRLYIFIDMFKLSLLMSFWGLTVWKK